MINTWLVLFDDSRVDVEGWYRVMGYSLRCVAQREKRNYNCFCCFFDCLAKTDLRFPSKIEDRLAKRKAKGG